MKRLLKPWPDRSGVERVLFIWLIILVLLSSAGWVWGLTSLLSKAPQQGMTAFWVPTETPTPTHTTTPTLTATPVPTATTVPTATATPTPSPTPTPLPTATPTPLSFNYAFVVEARKTERRCVNLNDGNRISGRFTIRGGANSDINFWIADPRGAAVYLFNQRSASEQSFGPYQAVQTGTHCLVFDNGFSSQSSKTINLQYTVYWR